MNEELKPCPFCGGEAKLVGGDDSDIYGVVIECDQCAFMTKPYGHEYDAAAAWNTRPASEGPTPDAGVAVEALGILDRIEALYGLNKQGDSLLGDIWRLALTTLEVLEASSDQTDKANVPRLKHLIERMEERMHESEAEAVVAALASRDARHAEDHPELDGTDAAHPAWWRGYDHACRSLVQRMTRCLDGKDDGSGVMQPDVEAFRRRLLTLADAERWKAEVEKAKAERDEANGLLAVVREQRGNCHKTMDNQAQRIADLEAGLREAMVYVPYPDRTRLTALLAKESGEKVEVFEYTDGHGSYMWASVKDPAKHGWDPTGRTSWLFPTQNKEA